MAWQSRGGHVRESQEDPEAVDDRLGQLGPRDLAHTLAVPDHPHRVADHVVQRGHGNPRGRKPTRGHEGLREEAVRQLGQARPARSPGINNYIPEMCNWDSYLVIGN